MPAIPAASTTASARYGLAEASDVLSSTFAWPVPSSVEPGTYRSGASRFSTPPERVRAREAAGPQPQRRGDARGGDRGQGRQVAQQPGEVTRTFPGQLPGSVEQVAPLAVDRGVQVPAVAGRAEADQQGEADGEAVHARGGVDGLAGEQLVIGGGDRIGGGQRQLQLRDAVLGVQLADPQAVGREVVQEGPDEAVEPDEGVRAVGGPGMAGSGQDVGTAGGSDGELQLVAGPEFEPALLGLGNLRFEDGALAVGPGIAVPGELPHGRPGERGLPGELDHGHEPDVPGGRREAGVGVGDGVVTVEDGEERGRPDATRGGIGEPGHGHDPRARDAVVVRPGEVHPTHSGGGEILRRGRRRLGHGHPLPCRPG
jgi:hypothetical protein